MYVCCRTCEGRFSWKGRIEFMLIPTCIRRNLVHAAILHHSYDCIEKYIHYRNANKPLRYTVLSFWTSAYLAETQERWEESKIRPCRTHRAQSWNWNDENVQNDARTNVPAIWSVNLVIDMQHTKLKRAETLSRPSSPCFCSVRRKVIYQLQHPPRAFEFLENFCSNPPSRGLKAVQIAGDQMPPPRETFW